jgi:hypothetical protein
MQPRVFRFAEYAATRYLHENAGKRADFLLVTRLAVAAKIRYRDESFCKTGEVLTSFASLRVAVKLNPSSRRRRTTSR